MSFFPSIRTIYFSAIIIGFLPTIFQRLPGPVHARLQALLPPSLVVSNARPKVYCYDSITTFDNDNTTQKCLAVYPNGTFGPILSPPPESIAKYHYTKGHVFPGMWDAHAHVLQYGEMLESVQLYGAESIEGAWPVDTDHHSRLLTGRPMQRSVAASSSSLKKTPVLAQKTAGSRESAGTRLSLVATCRQQYVIHF